MAKIYEAFVRYSADVSHLWSQTNNIRGRMVSSLRSAGTMAGKAFSTALTAAAGVGLAGIAVGGAATLALAKQSIDAAIESEQVQKRLAAVLRATGGAAGFSAEQLTAYASELQAATAFSDDSIMESMAVLATFKAVSGNAFKAAIEAAMNMSEVMGTDLKGSTMQVAKALQDPIQGINALRRAGVTFSEEQREQIKNFVETGRLAKAQQMILAELSGEFGGAARAAVESYAGAWKNLLNQLDDAKKSIGFAIMGHVKDFGPVMQAGADGVAAFAGELAGAISEKNLGGIESMNDSIAEAVALVLSLGDAWAYSGNEAVGYLLKAASLFDVKSMLGPGQTIRDPNMLPEGPSDVQKQLEAYEQIKADLEQRGADRLQRIRDAMEELRKSRGAGGAAGLGVGGGGAAAAPAAGGIVSDFLAGLPRRIGAGLGMAGLAAAGGIDAAGKGVAAGIGKAMVGGGGTAASSRRHEFIALESLNARIQSGLGAKTTAERAAVRTEKHTDDLVTIMKDRVAKGIEGMTDAVKKLNLGFGA